MPPSRSRSYASVSTNPSSGGRGANPSSRRAFAWLPRYVARAEANYLFQVVSMRYERSSIVLTSNKSVAEWPEVFGDHAIATAILDRLLHHSHVLSIKGNSYRLRERQMAAASAPQPAAAA